MKLWVKIIFGLLLGLGTGLLLGNGAEYLKPIGTVFLNLISMLTVPLVLSSIVVGITGIHDPKKLGRVGAKTLLIYLITTMAAIGLGLLFAKIFKLGSWLHLTSNEQINFEAGPSVSDMLLSIVPNNPFLSLANGNFLQIIVFAVFLGFAINFSGEKGKPLLRFFDSLASVMYRLTSIIMEFSPIGVFAIMAWVAGTFGLSVILPLLRFLFVYYLACLVHIAVIFCPILRFGVKVDPRIFFKKMGDAIMIAFSTCSSSASLPVSMQCAEERLGVSPNIASFMLPLGATINMNGAALFQGMSALFIAEAYGISMTWTQIVTLVVTATLSSIGAAGIPGTGFIMISVVFASVGLPIEGIALLAGIDRIREMGSTVLNVLGDAACALYVAKQEREFDVQIYNQDMSFVLEPVQNAREI